MGWLWHNNGDSTAKREAEINGTGPAQPQLQPGPPGEPAHQTQPQPLSQAQPQDNPTLEKAAPKPNPRMQMGSDENPETNPQRLRHANERFKDEGCCADLKSGNFWYICCLSNALT